MVREGCSEEGKERSHIKMLKNRKWKDLRRWSGPGYLRVVRVTTVPSRARGKKTGLFRDGGRKKLDYIESCRPLTVRALELTS